MLNVNAPVVDLWKLGVLPLGVCQGKDWVITRFNAALAKLLCREATGLAGVPLPGAMADMGLEKAFSVMEASGQGKPVLFHCRESLYLLQWRLLGEEENQNEESSEKLFFILEVSLAAQDAGGRAVWNEQDALIDSIFDGIWVTNADAVTIRVNKALENMTGISAADVEGKHIDISLKEGKYSACVAHRVLKEKRPVSMFDRYENGKCFLNTASPIFDDAGNVWRVVSCIRDMPALEELQNTLIENESESQNMWNQIRKVEGRGSADFIGASKAMRNVVKDIEKAARSDAIALILGETGTGKNLAAQAVHSAGPRKNEPFVQVNCGAIPSTLIESELFGYDKGAFTGASKSGKIGFFEAAKGGSIFLDEVTELPLHLQAKLLHVLDGHTFTRVGGIQPITLKARVIAATNRPLEDMVAQNEFREDLYYRLNVLSFRMPSLRERPEDIPILARHFLALANAKNSMNKMLKPEVFEYFSRYAWPGNVRELRAIIEYLVAMTGRAHIGLRDLPEKILAHPRDGDAPGVSSLGLKNAVARLERDLIAQAIAEAGSTWKAAKLLKISQASVVRKAQRYRLAINEVVHR